MCVGLTGFCCSSALLAFLQHRAALGATEKATHTRELLPFDASDLFYSLGGKKRSFGW